MTYIGFSATPSHAALRLFGVSRRAANGPEFAPAHCYSMEQAIRDKHVCNVLSDYTCVAPRFVRSSTGESTGLKNKKDFIHSSSKKAKSPKSTMDGGTGKGGGGGGRGGRGGGSTQEVIEYKSSFIAFHFARMLATARSSHAANEGGGDGGVEESGGFFPRGMVVCKSRSDVVSVFLPCEDWFALA